MPRRRPIRASDWQTELIACHTGKRIHASGKTERQLREKRSIVRIQRSEKLVAKLRRCIGRDHSLPRRLACISTSLLRGRGFVRRAVDGRRVSNSRVLDNAAEDIVTQVGTRQLRAVVDSLLAPPESVDVGRRGIPIDPASTGRHAPPCSRIGEEHDASRCVRAPRFH